MPQNELIQSNRTRVRAYLDSMPLSSLAANIVSSAPWIVSRFELEAAWTRPVVAKLAGEGFPNVGVHVVGSGAVGFSLSPTKMGSGFRELGSHAHPSDIDLAVVSPALFTRAWDEVLQEDYVAPRVVNGSVRSSVYWGRIDHPKLPSRTKIRPVLRSGLDALQRSGRLKGYKMTVRMYRRTEDLRAYLEWSMRRLLKELQS